MRVYCRAQYLTEAVESMRPADYRAIYLVKAVKGKEVGNGYEWVKIDGKNVKITNSNRDDAVNWFAEWAAEIIQRSLGNKKTVLLPIPNGAATLQSKPDFRTAIIADAVAKRLRNAVTAPVLRWRAARPKSTDIASRDPKVLYPELVWKAKPPAGDIVLVDDVYTSGGHATAVAWKVGDCGQTASLLVACGRTLHCQLNDPFEVTPEDLVISPRQ